MGYYTDQQRDCGKETDFQVIDDALRDEVRRAAAHISKDQDCGHEYDRLAQMVRQIEKRVHSAPEVVAECPFSGEVDLTPMPGGAAQWECPLCGEEHTEEPDERNT